METQQLLTAREAAKLLGRSPGTLQNWRVQRCGPPYIKLRGRAMYSAETLRRWIAGHESVDHGEALAAESEVAR